MKRIRQSVPDSGLGLQVRVLEPVAFLPSSIGILSRYLRACFGGMVPRIQEGTKSPTGHSRGFPCSFTDRCVRLRGLARFRLESMSQEHVAGVDQGRSNLTGKSFDLRNFWQ